jgi:hypothetical protein
MYAKHTVARLLVPIAIVSRVHTDIHVIPDSRLRSQSNTFTSIANTHSDLRQTDDGDATFVARCMPMANLKPIKARRRKTHALTSGCKYYLTMPSNTNTPFLPRQCMGDTYASGNNTHSASVRWNSEQARRPTFNNTKDKFVVKNDICLRAR